MVAKLDVIAAGLWQSPEAPPARGVSVLVEMAEAFPEHVDISVYKGRRWDGRDSLTLGLGHLTSVGWWVSGVGYLNDLMFCYPKRVRRWAEINTGEVP